MPLPGPDIRELYSSVVNHAHRSAFLSLRESAATTFIATVDGLFSAYWYAVGLLEGRVCGGPIVRQDVSLFELIHLAGNCLRHRHEWEAVPSDFLKPNAKKNIERLDAVGLNYLDTQIIGKIVEMLPFDRYLDFELGALEVCDFITATSQRYVTLDWAREQGFNYKVRFIPADSLHRPLLEPHIRERAKKLGTVAQPI